MDTEQNMQECFVKDLGIAAFLKMNGYKLKSRRGREFSFFVDPNEVDKFNQKQIDYVNSPFAEFDNEIMNLKKLPS